MIGLLILLPLLLFFDIEPTTDIELYGEYFESIEDFAEFLKADYAGK